MSIDFKEEDKRIRQLQKEKRSPDFIKSWLRGWRLVGKSKAKEKRK